MQRTSQTVLEVYVEQDCRPCEHARRLANRISERLPQVDVRLIDLSLDEHDRPASVFAVPTYLLNGELLSLGNPDEEELIACLQSALATR